MAQWMKALFGVCAVSMAVLAVSVAPAHAIPGCSSGVYANGGQFWSLCTAAPVKGHWAEAKIYFSSGYSSTVQSVKTPIGTVSVSDNYSAQGYVMDGPWVKVAY